MEETKRIISCTNDHNVAQIELSWEITKWIIARGRSGFPPSKVSDLFNLVRKSIFESKPLDQEAYKKLFE